MAVSIDEVTPRCEDFPSFHEVIAYRTDTVVRNASSFTKQFVCQSCGVSLVEMEICTLHIFCYQKV